MKLQKGNVFNRVCMSFCSQKEEGTTDLFKHVHLGPPNLTPTK